MALDGDRYSFIAKPVQDFFGGLPFLPLFIFTLMISSVSGLILGFLLAR